MKKLVTFLAAVSRMAKMLFTMLAAVSGCVIINHTMSTTKRIQTILQKFTANHRSAPVRGTLDARVCTAWTGSAVCDARAGSRRYLILTA